MLVSPEDDPPQDSVQLKVVAAIVLNANIGTILENLDSPPKELGRLQPTLLTRQGVETLPKVWLNGEMRTPLWTQSESEATQSPPDWKEDEVSPTESDLSCSEEEET